MGFQTSAKRRGVRLPFPVQKRRQLFDFLGQLGRVGGNFPPAVVPSQGRAGEGRVLGALEEGFEPRAQGLAFTVVQRTNVPAGVRTPGVPKPFFFQAAAVQSPGGVKPVFVEAGGATRSVEPEGWPGGKGSTTRCPPSRPR
jgi:hypothetical protein